MYWSGEFKEIEKKRQAQRKKNRGGETWTAADIG